MKLAGKTLSTYFVLSLFLNYCFAGNDNQPVGARSAGMAHTSVILPDIWASANNQAGLAYLEKISAAFYYENRFNVKALSTQAGAIAVPLKPGTIGFNYRYFGFSGYNESKFGLAIARKLGKSIALGVQMDYFHTHFANDYGNFGSLSAEIGLMVEPIENLFVGVHLFNVSQTKQKANPDENIPTIVRFGMGYSIQKKALISFETEKDLRQNPIFKGGLEFQPVKDLYLRCGLSSGERVQYAFGIGYTWKMATINTAFSHHKLLGYSPHISVIAQL